MTPEELSMQIQDYLDGRMSDAERRAFEARLAEDAELAGRVEAYRLAGEALREEPPALSPGFYTRLRARFEAAHQPRPRRWFRLLSWETAGLATAVILAGLVFGPFLVDRDYLPETPTAPAAEDMIETERQQRSNVRDDVVEQGLQDQEAPGRREGRLEGPEEPKPSLSETNEGADVETETSEFAPAPPLADSKEMHERRSRDVATARQAPAQAGIPGEEESTRLGKKGAVSDERRELEEEAAARDTYRAKADADQLEPRYAPPAEMEAAPRAEQKVAEKNGRGDRLEREMDALRSQVGRSQFFAVPIGVGLPPGVVERGELVEITDEAGWRQLLTGPAEQLLPVLGEYDPSSRIVLVGPRDRPLDCAHAVVQPTADAYEIRLLVLAPDSPELGHGCAFRLPLDGKRVRVVEPEPNR